MDVRLYKLAAPITAPWPGGGTLQLYPLPQDEVHAAEIAAGCHSVLRLGLELTARATKGVLTADALAALVTPVELALLLAWQQKAQRRADVDVSELREWLRKSVNDIPDVISDGVAAWHCEQGPVQYYGKPACELTQAQVSWFALLRDAFEHFHVGRPDREGKYRKAKPSKWWLMQDYEERVRWQIQDQ